MAVDQGHPQVLILGADLDAHGGAELAVVLVVRLVSSATWIRVLDVELNLQCRCQAVQQSSPQLGRVVVKQLGLVAVQVKGAGRHIVELNVVPDCLAGVALHHELRNCVVRQQVLDAVEGPGLANNGPQLLKCTFVLVAEQGLGHILYIKALENFAACSSGAGSVLVEQVGHHHDRQKCITGSENSKLAGTALLED